MCNNKIYFLLFSGVIFHDVEMVTVALENGADPNCLDHYDLIHESALFRDDKKLINLINRSREEKCLLLPFLANLRNPDYKDAAISILKLLIQFGLNVNAISINSESLLHYYVTHNAQEIVQSLIEHGAEIDNTNEERNYTPLQIAIENANVKMVKLLLGNKADPNFIFCDDDQVPLALYAETPLCTLMRNAYEKQTDFSEDDYSIFMLLLEHGADVLLLSNQRQASPLYYSCLDSNLMKLVPILLSKGADSLIFDNLDRGFDIKNNVLQVALNSAKQGDQEYNPENVFALTSILLHLVKDNMQLPKIFWRNNLVQLFWGKAKEFENNTLGIAAAYNSRPGLFATLPSALIDEISSYASDYASFDSYYHPTFS